VKRSEMSNAGECAQTSGEEGGVIGGVSAQMESGGRNVNCFLLLLVLICHVFMHFFSCLACNAKKARWREVILA
jgi:hypothetical protein